MDFYTYIAREYVIPYYIHFLRSEMLCTLLEKGSNVECQLMVEFDEKIQQYVNNDKLILSKLDKIEQAVKQRLKEKQRDTFNAQLMLFEDERRLAYDKLFKFLSTFDKIHTLHQVLPQLYPFDTDLIRLKEVCLSHISQVKQDYAPKHKQIAKISSYGLPFLGYKLNIDIRHFTLRLENIFDIVAMQRFLVKKSDTGFPSVTLLQSLVLTIDTNEDDRSQSENFVNGSPRKFFADYFNYFLEAWRVENSSIFSVPFTHSSYESIRNRELNEKTYFLSYPMLSSVQLRNCRNFPALLTDCAATWLEGKPLSKLDDFISRWEFAPNDENWHLSVDTENYMRIVAFDLIIEGVDITEKSSEDEWQRSSQMLLVRYLANLDFDVFYQDIAFAAGRLDGVEIKFHEPFKAFVGHILMLERNRQYSLAPPSFSSSATEVERKQQEQIVLQKHWQMVLERYNSYRLNLFDVVRELFLFQHLDTSKIKNLLFEQTPKKTFNGFISLLSEELNILSVKKLFASELKNSNNIDILALPTADFNLKRIELASKCLSLFKMHFRELSQSDHKKTAKEQYIAKNHGLQISYENVIVSNRNVQHEAQREIEKLKQSNEYSAWLQANGRLDFSKKTNTVPIGNKSESKQANIKTEDVLNLHPVVLFGLRFNGKFFQSSVKELVVELNQSDELFKTLEVFYLVDFLTVEEIRHIYSTGVTDDVLSTAYHGFSFGIDGIDNYDLLNEWSVIQTVIRAYIQKQSQFKNLPYMARSFAQDLEGRQDGNARKIVEMSKVIFSEMMFI